MCRDSLARWWLAGWMRSPSCLEQRGHRVLGQPVDLQVRHARAQLARDGEVARRVPEPDRRGDVQRPRPAVRAVDGGIARPAARPLGQPSQREVDRHRLARVGDVASLGHRDQLTAGRARQRHGVGVGRGRIVGGGDDEHRAAHPPRQRALVAPRRGRGEVGGGAGDQGLRIGLERPPDRVLDLLGRVRRGEVAVARHQSAKAPKSSRHRTPLKRIHPTAGRRRVSSRSVTRGCAMTRQRRPRSALTGNHGDTKAAASTRSGWSAASSSPRWAPSDSETTTARSVAGRVEHGERVAGELGLGVLARTPRPVGPAVAARVERHHAEVPGQVRDLGLPDARVVDRPRRDQQQRRVAVAVALPEDPHPVALDEPLLVGVAGARLLARGCRGRDGRDGRRSVPAAQAPVESAGVV